MVMEAENPFVGKKSDDHGRATQTVLNYLENAPTITADLINRPLEVYELFARGPFRNLRIYKWDSEMHFYDELCLNRCTS